MAFIDVIKYEGDNATLVFKHPIEDFNRKAQLIVHETQTAYVFQDGVASKEYKPGKYILESKNIPGVKHIIGTLTGGELQNHCEVYFINMVTALNIPWATSPMDIRDVSLKIPYPFQANGTISVKVGNAELLLKRIVGTTRTFSAVQFQILFETMITTTAKEVISRLMVNEKYQYHELNSNLKAIAHRIQNNIEKEIEEYGLTIQGLYIDSIELLKDTTYADQISTMAEVVGNKAAGIDTVTGRSLDILKTQAANTGPSSVAAGVAGGISMGMVGGQYMGNALNNGIRTLGYGEPGMSDGRMHTQPSDIDIGIIAPKPYLDDEMKEPNKIICENCGKEIGNDSKYCSYCGTAIQHKMTCINCDSEIMSNMSFCPYCGKKVK